jgi:hypothetical protein
MQNTAAVKQGRPNSLPFQPEKIVDGFKQETILQAHPNCLTDILPRLYDNEADREILDSWKCHFKSKNWPFVVTKLPTVNKKWPAVFTIWAIALS